MPSHKTKIRKRNGKTVKHEDGSYTSHTSYSRGQIHVASVERRWSYPEGWKLGDYLVEVDVISPDGSIFKSGKTKYVERSQWIRDAVQELADNPPSVVE